MTLYNWSISKLSEQTEIIRKIASSQIIAFSEAFQVKWHEPFDFPTGISSLVACNNILKSLICLGF